MTVLVVVAWVGASLAVLALLLTVVNGVTWPRGRPGRVERGVSVLIPARNEAATIEAAVRAALDAEGPVSEVIVYDDGSTDGTGERVIALAEGDRRVTLLHGVPLPAGWVGKPHACHRLAAAATGDLLLFVDADTVLAPDGVARIAALAEDHGADVVTAVPHQVTGSVAEHLILPLLHLTYVSWLPLVLVHRSGDPRFLAANGQVLAVSRAAYEQIGGFEAVRGEVVDDMAFCRRAKVLGRRVVFADGDRIARCRMYDSARAVWAGFSKNVYEGLGSPLLLAVVITVYLLAFVAPWAAVVASPWQPTLLLPAALGVGANLLQRAILAIRHGHRLVSVVLHPAAVLGLVAIALNSWRWSRAGRIRWAGRTYAARAVRGG